MSIENITSKLSSTLFLTICILLSCAAFIDIIRLQFPIILILVVIACWIIFAAAKSNKLTESRSGLNLLSGSILARKIVNWVIVGILTICAVITMIAGPVLLNAVKGNFNGELNNYDISTDLDDILNDKTVNDLENKYLSKSNIRQYNDVLNNIKDWIESHDSYDISNAVVGVGIAVTLAAGIFILVVAVMLALINIFFYRNLHKFTKSLCESYESGSYQVKISSGLKGWTIVMAVLSGLSLIGSSVFVLSGISAACMCAAYILFCIILSKTLKESANA